MKLGIRVKQTRRKESKEEQIPDQKTKQKLDKKQTIFIGSSIQVVQLK